MVAVVDPTVVVLHPSDRAAERAIRERVAETVSRSLGDGRLLTPGSQDEERVRAIIDDEVVGYERRAVTTNGPLLLDADAVRRRLFAVKSNPMKPWPWSLVPILRPRPCSGMSSVFPPVC